VTDGLIEITARHRGEWYNETLEVRHVTVETFDVVRAYGWKWKSVRFRLSDGRVLVDVELETPFVATRVSENGYSVGGLFDLKRGEVVHDRG